MLEAHHYSTGAAPKGSYALPAAYDGRVNKTLLHAAVRGYMNNQRQGTASTKTRAEVSGGGSKPWRQKGTGRARQGTTRAPHWVGGGVAFGPKPRSYRTDIPRKMRRLARQSALNARAGEGAIHVIESLTFDGPKTRQLAELIARMGLAGKKILVLTAEVRQEIYLSGRNLPQVEVMRYQDVAAYNVLWADALIIEEGAIDGHHVEGSEKEAETARTRRVKKSAEQVAKTSAKTTKRTTKAAKKATKRAAKSAKSAKPAKKATKAATKKKKGGDDA
ncbi:MAG TPA: 50S ribosomal protein L4 [Gemmatimonadales bacterium]